jgi:hypothetical protein
MEALRLVEGQEGCNMLPRRFAAAAFTLVEVAAATVFIGLGVTALMVSVRSGTTVNESASELSRASYLVGETREYLLKQQFENVAAMAGAFYTPPHDANGQQMTSMSNWRQDIAVQYRKADQLTQEDTTHNSGVLYVTVTVSHGGNTLLSNGFLVARRPTE